MKVTFQADGFSTENVRRAYLKARFLERYKLLEVDGNGKTIRITKMDLPEVTARFGYGAAMMARDAAKEPFGFFEVYGGLTSA